jgi:hypothetical protein
MDMEKFTPLEGLMKLLDSTSRKPIVHKIPKSYKKQYQEVFKKLDIDEDYQEDFFINYDGVVASCESFFKRHPKYHVVRDFMDDVLVLWHKFDKRDENLIIYRPEVVLMVVLFAKANGCTDFEQYADFWLRNNLYFQYLLPGMPEPKHMITSETIRTICTIVKDEDMDDLFKAYFGEVRNFMKEVTHDYKDLPPCIFDEVTGDKVDFLSTFGFDGQEIRASSQEGKVSRKCKRHGVSLYACECNTVLAAMCVNKKNQELSSFFKMYSSIMGVFEDHLVISDSLNARKDFFDFCDFYGIDYCMPIKAAYGLKPLFNKFNEFFTEENLNTLESHEILTQSHNSLEHGRYETVTYTLVSIKHFDKDLLPSQRIKCVLRRVKTSQRVVKTATKEEQAKLKPTTEVHYYVLSLDFCNATLLQAIHSIGVHWNYEAHHNILDTVLLQDMQAVSTDNTASFIIKSNKMVFNLLTYVRARTTRTTPKGAVKVPSYKQVMAKMSNPLTAFKYFIDYFLDRPETESEQEQA